MENVNRAEWIEEAVAGKSFRLAGINSSKGYDLRKLWVGTRQDTWVKQQFPGTEIVHDVHSIINDEEIDLVIMPTRQNEELKLVAQVLQKGKNLRIV